MDHIRNFCIIAHIDHGKSTLADRLIQRCGAVEDREFRDQILDSMDLERERGITIKAQHRHPAVHRPGREDVRAEPDRHARPRRLLPRGAPLADELRGRAAGGRRLPGGGGADGREPLSRHGVRPRGRAGDQQDRPAVRRRGPGDGGDRPRPRARPLRVGPGARPRWARASTTLLEAIVTKLPPPKGDPQAPLRALLFDAQYDAYRGVVLLVRVFDGRLKTADGQKIRLMHSARSTRSRRSGNQPSSGCRGAELAAGEVGYVHRRHQEPRPGWPSATPSPRPTGPAAEPLPGYQARRSPSSSRRSTRWPPTTTRTSPKALEKLKLNDASLTYQKDSLGRPRLRLPLRLPRAAPPRRSCRSGWSASTTCRCSSPLPRSATDRAQQRQGGLVDNPTLFPDPAQHQGSRRAATSRRRS